MVPEKRGRQGTKQNVDQTYGPGRADASWAERCSSHLGQKSKAGSHTHVQCPACGEDSRPRKVLFVSALLFLFLLPGQYDLGNADCIQIDILSWEKTNTLFSFPLACIPLSFSIFLDNVFHTWIVSLLLGPTALFTHISQGVVKLCKTAL